MKQEVLLAEVEDLLRTMPNRATLAHNNDENYSWFGRVAEFVDEWDPIKSPVLELRIAGIQSNIGTRHDEGASVVLHS